MLHAETLPHADVVEERGLLDGHRHVDHGHIGIVERVQGLSLAKVELLERNRLQRGTNTETVTIIIITVIIIIIIIII